MSEFRGVCVFLLCIDRRFTYIDHRRFTYIDHRRFTYIDHRRFTYIDRIVVLHISTVSSFYIYRPYRRFTIVVPNPSNNTLSSFSSGNMMLGVLDSRYVSVT